MIRILRVQSRICIGGPALNTIFLSAHMDPEQYETLLVGGALNPDEKTLAPLAHDKGVAIHTIKEMGRSLNWRDDLRALKQLMELMRLYKPHVVHTHTAKAGTLGRVAAFLCRVPVRVHTFHGHVFHGYFSAKMSKLVVLFERCLSMISTKIVTISPRQKEEISEIYGAVPPKKCEVIRLGFDLDKITSGQPGNFKKRMGLASETRLVAILARLVPIKNHELLIDALGHLKIEDPNLRFLIIGDGDLRASLEKKVTDLGLSDQVLFTGWQGDVAEIYADLELNVLVSKNEGTPVTLIEGLACGVPVLTTDVGGVRDFVDETTGVIVPADVTPEALAQQLSECLEKPRRLSKEQRKKILETFSYQRLVRDMEELYQRLLGKNQK